MLYTVTWFAKVYIILISLIKLRASILEHCDGQSVRMCHFWAVKKIRLTLIPCLLAPTPVYRLEPLSGLHLTTRSLSLRFAGFSSLTATAVRLCVKRQVGKVRGNQFRRLLQQRTVLLLLVPMQVINKAATLLLDSYNRRLTTRLLIWLVQPRFAAPGRARKDRLCQRQVLELRRFDYLCNATASCIFLFV